MHRVISLVLIAAVAALVLIASSACNLAEVQQARRTNAAMIDRLRAQSAALQGPGSISERAALAAQYSEEVQELLYELDVEIGDTVEPQQRARIDEIVGVAQEVEALSREVLLEAERHQAATGEVLGFAEENAGTLADAEANAGLNWLWVALGVGGLGGGYAVRRTYKSVAKAGRNAVHTLADGFRAGVGTVQREAQHLVANVRDEWGDMKSAVAMSRPRRTTSSDSSGNGSGRLEAISTSQRMSQVQ